MSTIISDVKHYRDRCIFHTNILKDALAPKIAMKCCAEDPVFFINNFVWTYDPRIKPAERPFVLYDFQEELVNELKNSLDNKEPLFVVKSRDMGLSWTICSFFCWGAIFIPGFAATIGSRKQPEVDDGTIFSLMPKLSFIIERLPDYMRRGFEPDKHKTHMKLIIPEMESTIRGECGDNIGRGGRSTMLFIDEFAHVMRSARVMEAVSQNTDVPIFGSTPNGKGNEFARINYDGKIKKLLYKWQRHPNKTKEWYEKQKNLMTQEQIAQELDCDFAKSTKGRVFPQFDFELHCKPNLYDLDLPTEISFDFGINDPTAVVFFQRTPTEVRIIDYIEVANATITDVMTKIKAKGYKLSKIAYGDPDGAKRDRITGHSVFKHLQVHYNITVRTKRELVRNGIFSVRNLLEKNRLVVDNKLRHFIDCLENYKFPEKETGENEKPLHDWTSHGMDAMRYYIDYHFPLLQSRKVTTQNIR